MNLLEQQQNRRDQLLETINNIEQQRFITVGINLNITVFILSLEYL